MDRSWRLYVKEKGSGRHGLRNHDEDGEDGDGWLRYHGSGEARPCRRREFRHGRHGSREETANRITLGGRGRFLTVDLPPDTPPPPPPPPPLAHSNPAHSSRSPRHHESSRIAKGTFRTRPHPSAS
ncbi:hypothetical protein HZU73_07695 [Apis mellifera caucasica]|nr:hypothetical protein HZU73_07695 [Apis mellifera caucasica]